jgi:ketosteroid isomerase-like protein
MADTPEALIDEFKAGFLTSDPDAIADCYEDDAIYVMAAMGLVAEGKEAIRDA